MRMFVRLLIKLVLLWLIASVERVIGIPALFLVLSGEWSTQLGGVWRYFWLLFAAVVLAALFELSPVVAFLLLCGLELWSTASSAVVRSKTLSLLIGTMVGSALVGWFMPGQPHLGSWVYVAMVVIALVVVMKRRRLTFTYKRLR